MRKAVNYAARPHGVRSPGGAVRGDAVRPVPPAGHARLRGHRGLPRPCRISSTARNLAGWHPGDPLRPITVYYRSSGTVNPAQYQVVKSNLEQIGFDVTGVGWLRRGDLHPRSGPGASRSTSAVSVGLVLGLPRPVELHAACSTARLIHDGPGNINFSYFDDPGLQRAAARGGRSSWAMSGTTRSGRSSTISCATRRPAAAVRTYNNRDLFSRADGLPALQRCPSSAGVDFAQPLRAARDHDRRRGRSSEPATRGPRSSTFPCA